MFPALIDSGHRDDIHCAFDSQGNVVGATIAALYRSGSGEPRNPAHAALAWPETLGMWIPALRSTLAPAADETQARHVGSSPASESRPQREEVAQVSAWSLQRCWISRGEARTGASSTGFISMGSTRSADLPRGNGLTGRHRGGSCVCAAVMREIRGLTMQGPSQWDSRAPLHFERLFANLRLCTVSTLDGFVRRPAVGMRTIQEAGPLRTAQRTTCGRPGTCTTPPLPARPRPACTSSSPHYTLTSACSPITLATCSCLISADNPRC
jgi:hypothetical protein